jgi:hypothetical protein
MHDLEDRGGRGGGVVEVGRLLGGVADTAGVAREDHGRGDLHGQDARIVAGEARHAAGVAERGAQLGVELDAVRARRHRQLGARGEVLEPGGERRRVLGARVSHKHVGSDRRQRVGLDEDPRRGDDHVLGGAGGRR